MQHHLLVSLLERCALTIANFIEKRRTNSKVGFKISFLREAIIKQKI